MPRRNHLRPAPSQYGEHPDMAHAEDDRGEYEPESMRHGNGWGDRARWAADGMREVPRFVSDRPHTSVMTAFGVGFGLGLVVTLLLTREEKSWFERYAPDAMRDLPDRFEQARQQLASVPCSIRNAGESLASRVPASLKWW
jgi:hypothetical protein